MKPYGTEHRRKIPMSDNCIYPYYAGTTSYKKGCRCLRCRTQHKEKNKAARVRYNQSEKGKQTKKEIHKKYRQTEEGRKKHNEYCRKYNKTFKGKVNTMICNAKRRERLQTILTAEEMENIQSIYEECQRISQETGIPHHVDHIIPLAKGGQHHPSNLQILSATENLKKGTKIVL